jgi:hypothetical protein
VPGLTVEAIEIVSNLSGNHLVPSGYDIHDSLDPDDLARGGNEGRKAHLGSGPRYLLINLIDTMEGLCLFELAHQVTDHLFVLSGTPCLHVGFDQFSDLEYLDCLNRQSPSVQELQECVVARRV